MFTHSRYARLAAPLALASVLLQATAGPALSAAPTAMKPATAVVLPRQPAPLGLSFGMRPEEVPLPVVVPPPPLGTVTPLRTLPPRVAAAAPVPLSSPAAPLAPSARPAAGTAQVLAPLPPRPLGGAAATRVPLDGHGDYLRACEGAFDRISALAGGDRDWLAWRARHLQGGEGSDFSDDIADRAGLSVAPAPTLVRAADGWRSAGLYRFDGGDGRRLVCLLFTANGLAQVFLAGHALDGLRDEVIVRLERQRRLDRFAVTREARRFSLSLRRPACGIYCRLFGERMLVERRLWLNRSERILVGAKRGLIASGLTGAFSGGAESEVFDGLPDSFLVSIDLGRRAFVLRQPSAAAPAAGAGRAGGTQAPAPRLVGAAPTGVVESFVP
jgi:hypothetical protein